MNQLKQLKLCRVLIIKATLLALIYNIKYYKTLFEGDLVG